MEYDFHFIGKTIPVTIYKTGQVRFSKQAVEEFQSENSRLRWGVDSAHQLLAFKKDDKGKRLRGGRSFTINCPIKIAQNFVGKFTIELVGENHILHRIST